MTGSRLTGFMFGKDVLVGRIYDKTVEIRRRGLSWLPDLWGADGQGRGMAHASDSDQRSAAASMACRPVWEEIRDIRIAPGMTGVVRRRLQEADELRLVQGFQGYASSLAARRDRLELGDAMEDFGTLLRRYLESRGRESPERWRASSQGNLV
jgi:hypothetical protein